jgi:hypothetical protein
MRGKACDRALHSIGATALPPVLHDGHEAAAKQPLPRDPQQQPEPRMGDPHPTKHDGSAELKPAFRPPVAGKRREHLMLLDVPPAPAPGSRCGACAGWHWWLPSGAAVGCVGRVRLVLARGSLI